MVDHLVSGANLPMGRQVLNHSLVLGVGVQARDGHGQLLLASWTDDACPDALLQYKTFTFVQEPLDVDTWM